MRLVGRIFCTLLFLGAAPLSAQSATTLGEIHPGSRVRISAPGVVAGRYDGTVLSRTGDTLTLASPSSTPVAVPLSRITALEVSRGKSHSAGAIRGLQWGVPIGLALGVLFAATDTSCTNCSKHSAGEVIGSFTLASAIWGAGIGALIGRERWERFDLAQHASLGIRPDGGTLALRYAF